MPRYSASANGAAGTAALPIAAVYSGGDAIILREIKCFTTAANAARIRIVRVSTAGTWTALTEAEFAENARNPSGTAVHTASSTAPTITAGDVDVGAIGAAIGSGFHYTYYGEFDLVIAAGTGNGIALIEVADTANTYDTTFIWDE